MLRPPPGTAESDKPRAPAPQVKRYWPGRAPDWVKPDEEAADDEALGEQADVQQVRES